MDLMMYLVGGLVLLVGMAVVTAVVDRMHEHRRRFDAAQRRRRWEQRREGRGEPTRQEAILR
ncbi:hypothetical protein [Pseudonocardia sp.]|uniref:hypothetical protein n=1 Tax=Pseudonocardia sp. TaxID=60912 RepID=UPI003D0FEA2B